MSDGGISLTMAFICYLIKSIDVFRRFSLYSTLSRLGLQILTHGMQNTPKVSLTDLMRLKKKVCIFLPAD